MTAVGMSYKYPLINPDVSGNYSSWMSVAPYNGASFRSDQNQSILINVASNSAFLSTVQSFLSGTITAHASDDSVVVSAVTRNSFSGISRVFQRLIIRFNGVVVEQVDSYNDLCSLYYATTRLSKKALLRTCEGYGDTTALASGKKEWAHLIMSSLWVTPQTLPLPLIEGSGIQLEFVLADKASLFTTTNIAYYKLFDVCFKYLAVTPSPAFTIGLKNAVRAGRSAVIPYQKIHQFRSAGAGSKNLIVNIALGQVSSLVDVTTVFWDDVKYADPQYDKGLRFHNADVLDWRFTGADVNSPNLQAFKFNKGSTPESTLMGFMTQCGNVYDMHADVSLETNHESNSFRMALNFSSDGETFASGLSTLAASSPFCVLTATTDTVVSPTTSILTFATVDAIIRFQGSEIQVSEII